MAVITPVDKSGRPLLSSKGEPLFRYHPKPGEIYPSAHLALFTENGESAVLQRSKKDDFLANVKLPLIGGKEEHSDIHIEPVSGRRDPSLDRIYERTVRREAKQEGGLEIPEDRTLSEGGIVELHKGILELNNIHRRDMRRPYDLFVVIFGGIYNPDIHGEIRVADKKEVKDLRIRYLTNQQIRKMLKPLEYFGEQTAEAIIEFRSQYTNNKVSGNIFNFLRRTGTG